MVRDIIGEIKRPLIFKLKSLFQLYEIVASKMYVKDCLYPTFDAVFFLSVGKAFVDAGLTGAATGAQTPTNTVVPAGKRWIVQSLGLRQTTAVAAAAVAHLSFRHGSAGTDTVVSNSTVISSDSSIVGFPYGMIMDVGDQINLFVDVAVAASTFEVSMNVTEIDFRENVV